MADDMRGWLASWLRDLADTVYVPVCHVCGVQLTEGERYVCRQCLDNLPRSGYHRHEMNPMEERFAGLFPFERATGHFLYSRGSEVAHLVHDMKYRGFKGLGEVLGARVGEELYGTGFFAGVDAIVPVPMHWFKRARRGYNQVDSIAAGLSAATGMPVVGALRAVKGHGTQTALGREARLANARGLFAVDKGALGAAGGSHLLLVDDVCTTGATLASAAEALWKANPSALTILALGVAF